MDRGVIIEHIIRELPYKLDVSNPKVFEIIDKISETILQTESRRGREIPEIYPIVLREIFKFFSDKESLFAVQKETTPGNPVQDTALLTTYQLLSEHKSIKNAHKLTISNVVYKKKYNITGMNNVFSFREIKIIDPNTSKTIMSDVKKCVLNPGMYYLEDFIEIFNFRINSITGLQFKYFLDWDKISNEFYIVCNENSVEKTGYHYITDIIYDKQCMLQIEASSSMNNEIFKFPTTESSLVVSEENTLFFQNESDMMKNTFIKILFDNNTVFMTPFQDEFHFEVNGITDVDSITLDSNHLDIQDCIIRAISLR
jgi:hypothetical protein